MAWTIFAGIPFVLEPFVQRRALIRHAERDAAGAFALVECARRVLLGRSLVTTADAVARIHGWSCRQLTPL